MARALGKPVVLVRDVPHSLMPGIGWLAASCDAVLDGGLGVQLARFNPVGVTPARPTAPVYAGARDPREAPAVRALLDSLTVGAGGADAAGAAGGRPLLAVAARAVPRPRRVRHRLRRAGPGAGRQRRPGDRPARLRHRRRRRVRGAARGGPRRRGRWPGRDPRRAARHLPRPRHPGPAGGARCRPPSCPARSSAGGRSACSPRSPTRAQAGRLAAALLGPAAAARRGDRRLPGAAAGRAGAGRARRARRPRHPRSWSATAPGRAPGRPARRPRSGCGRWPGWPARPGSRRGPPDGGQPPDVPARPGLRAGVRAGGRGRASAPRSTSSPAGWTSPPWSGPSLLAPGGPAAGDWGSHGLRLFTIAAAASAGRARR